MLSTQLIALQVLTVREIKRFMRIWIQTILPPAISAALYLMIFGHLIGEKIGVMAGFTYVEFLVPGIIIMSSITNAYSNTASSFFSAKFQRSIEELLSSPMNNHVILLGYLSGGTLRGIMVAIAVFIVTSLFNWVPPFNPIFALYIVIITSFLFSCMGFINGVLAKDFDGISIIPTFVLLPLTYLGGVFFSIDLLSETWASVAKLNPILHIINQFRYAMIGLEANSMLISSVFLLFVAIGFYWTCYQFLIKRYSLGMS